MEETPIDKTQAYSSGVITTLHLVAYYAIAVGIWGLVFHSLIWFVAAGAVLGLLLGFISGMVVAKQRTNEKSREIMFAAGSLWGNLAGGCFFKFITFTSICQI